MELITLLGFIGAFATVTIGILFTTAGNLEAMSRYLDVASIFITVGGSFCAMTVMHYQENLKNFLLILRKAFLKNEFEEPSQLITTLISYSEKARREGLLSLEDDIIEMQDPYFKKALQLVIDGTDPEVVKQVLTSEIDYITIRHAGNRKMYEDLADLSPAFGLVGTLIGLIFALGSIGGDITILARGMSTALLTTLYGSMLANAVWNPIANKLNRKTGSEIFNKELILEGVLSIQFGDNPRILQQKLLSGFSQEIIDRMEKSE